MVDAEQARNRGDITAALRIVSKALQEDPENRKLAAVHGILARQAEKEAQQGKILGNTGERPQGACSAKFRGRGQTPRRGRQH